jgi:uncharacterized protein YaaQ
LDRTGFVQGGNLTLIIRNKEDRRIAEEVYLSLNEKCKNMVQNNIIVDTAPLWSRFIGQPVDNLTNWLVYFEMSELKEDSIGKEP